MLNLENQTQNPKKAQTANQAIKPSWVPSNTLLLMTAIVFSILNISRGDPGLMLVCGSYAGCMMYADKLNRFFTFPKKIKIILLAAISIPGSFLMQQINSPSFAIFFGGFKTFLNTTLGTLIPGSGPFFDIFVALLQFVFVVYMIIKGLKAFRERDNDEEWVSILKVPVISLVTLSVFDFVLTQVTAA